MNQKTEYLIVIERPNGTKFGRKIFKNKNDALEYAKEMEKKYMYFIIHMLEI